eukprot:4715119-Amphidinium_carterae.1
MERNFIDQQTATPQPNIRQFSRSEVSAAPHGYSRRPPNFVAGTTSDVASQQSDAHQPIGNMNH